MTISLRPERRFAVWSLIALLAAVAVALLPVTLIIPVVLILLIVLLLPASPLGALVVLLTLAPLRTLIATESAISFPLAIGEALLLLYFGFWFAYRLSQRKPNPEDGAQPGTARDIRHDRRFLHRCLE